jgi:hypothetical protein
MSFWNILSLIIAVSTASFVSILFVVRRLSRERSIYIFRTEDGEEIPLGI